MQMLTWPFSSSLWASGHFHKSSLGTVQVRSLHTGLRGNIRLSKAERLGLCDNQLQLRKQRNWEIGVALCPSLLGAFLE